MRTENRPSQSSPENKDNQNNKDDKLTKMTQVGELTHSHQLDPLFVIFEQHLYHFQDSETDRKTFVEVVVKEYISYLQKFQIVIPKPMEAAVVEELSAQVNVMLIKKIYGFLSIDDYQKAAPGETKRKAKKKHSKLTRVIKAVSNKQ